MENYISLYFRRFSTFPNEKEIDFMIMVDTSSSKTTHKLNNVIILLFSHMWWLLMIEGSKRMCYQGLWWVLQCAPLCGRWHRWRTLPLDALSQVNHLASPPLPAHWPTPRTPVVTSQQLRRVITLSVVALRWHCTISDICSYSVMDTLYIFICFTGTEMCIFLSFMYKIHTFCRLHQRMNMYI